MCKKIIDRFTRSNLGLVALVLVMLLVIPQVAAAGWWEFSQCLTEAGFAYNDLSSWCLSFGPYANSCMNYLDAYYSNWIGYCWSLCGADCNFI